MPEVYTVSIRNGIGIRCGLQESEIHFMAAMQGISNPYFYGYWVFPQELQHKAVAAFEPMRRTMMLPRVPFEQNVFYELIKMHELVHVYQASQHRKAMGLQNYMRFYSEEKNEQKNFLDDEVQAYGQEIEGLNLLLHGKLKEQARCGEMLDIDSIHEQLQIPQIFRMPLQMTLFFAKFFYKNNEENGVYPNEFVNHVMRMLIFDGYKVYVFKGGVPQLIVPQEIPSH